MTLPIYCWAKYITTGTLCWLLSSVLYPVYSNPLFNDREIAIVNGSPVSENQYPVLTALLSGRKASIRINGQQANGQFFGHGVQAAFDGYMSNCGSAANVCQSVEGKICLIFTAALSDPSGITPAEQLKNCSLGGGIGAIFRSDIGQAFRTDLFDGDASIPAVFIGDFWSYATLSASIALTPSNNTVRIEVEPVDSQSILCGAAYLGNQWLVTAAHCVLDQTPEGVRLKLPWEIQASVGAHHLIDDAHLVQQVIEIVVNDFQLQGIGSRNDIALLKLADEPLRARQLATSEANLSTEIKVAAPGTVESQSYRSLEALVLGWGSTEVREPLAELAAENATSLTPRSALLTLRPVEECAEQWGDFLQSNNFLRSAITIDRSHICAYAPLTQRDTCQGDSGGPLLIEVEGKLELAGITSFGLGCGSANGVPGVYTKVGAYADWIKTVTRIDVLSRVSPDESGPVNPVVTVAGSAASTYEGGGSIGLPLLMLSLLLRRRALVLVSCFGLSACQYSGSQSSNDRLSINLANDQLLEKLDIDINGDKLQLRVLSNGCTKADHFKLFEDTTARCSLKVVRIRPDLCKRATDVAAFTISIEPAQLMSEECRLSTFVNPPLSAPR